MVARSHPKLNVELKSNCPERQILALGQIARLAARQPDEVIQLISPVSELLGSNHEEIVALSSWTLGQIGHERPCLVEQALPTLATLLQHPSERVRQCTVWSLGQIGEVDPHLIRTLLPAIVDLVKDPSASVRFNMMWACESIAACYPEWLAPYADRFFTLFNDRDIVRVQREAPVLLTAIVESDPALHPAAIAALEQKIDSADDIVRMHVIEALTRLKHKP